jgi:4'-phosphopantetheinyl transferase
MDAQLCHVWVADVARHRPVHDALLDDIERSRAEAFLRPADRSRFVLGVALVKFAVAGIAGLEPAAVHVDRRCDECGRPHGRPRLPGSDVHLSVSHSGALVVVALTRAGPVGVDVEHRDPARPAPPADVLTAAEPLGRPQDLLIYWCRKESVVKATGEGLRVPLQEVVVSPADGFPRLVSYQGRPLAASMADLDVGDSYAAALTVLTAGPLTVDTRSADSLLGV